MKFNNLLKQEFKIVENRKKVFIAPAIIVALALICLLIYGLALREPINLGMDFAGGYNVTVTLGAKIDDKKVEKQYKNKIVDIVEGLTDEEGKPYKIHVSSVQKQGSGEGMAILVRYKAVRDEIEMEEKVNKALYEKLNEEIFLLTPTVVYGDTISVSYEIPQNKYDVDMITKKLVDAGFETEEVNINASDNKKLDITLSAPIAEDKKADFVNALTIDDRYAGKVINSGLVSATVSKELLMNAISAVLISILLMLLYIAIRFKFLSGVSAVIALAHDILIMFCGMIIFHIELNGTFIAALITILGYSINNTIVIFDRVRGDKRLYTKLGPASIANKAVQETIWRSINTTITTLITITMVALIGVPNIKIFVLPIIFGLLAGTYSSIFVAPSIWAMLRMKFPEKLKASKAGKAKAQKKSKIA